MNLRTQKKRRLRVDVTIVLQLLGLKITVFCFKSGKIAGRLKSLKIIEKP